MLPLYDLLQIIERKMREENPSSLHVLEKGVIEPVWVKQQALKSAAEVASMILRIDNVIAATKPKAEGMPSRGEE
jgi:chaperonin GroEL (HSP60 family)